MEELIVIIKTKNGISPAEVKDCINDFFGNNNEECLDVQSIIVTEKDKEKNVSVKNSVFDKHDKLRNILIENNNVEYGDCIIDEICELFNHPTTNEVE